MTVNRRVVVTGIGAMTPFGYGVESLWQGIKDGKSCISTVEGVNLEGLEVKVGGQIKWLSEGGWFDPAVSLEKKDVNRLSKFIIYSLFAAKEAMADSNLVITEEMSTRCGAIIGSGIGGMDVTEKVIFNTIQKDPSKVSPFYIPSILTNLAPSHVSMRHNLKGINSSVSTACASGNNAIGDAAEVIKRGDADVMFAGGSESTFCISAFAGFSALRALSTNNEIPEKASRPYDKKRDGFVMSEGGAVLILEEYEQAKKRGAKIYAEITGYGFSSDAYHMTAPEPEGRGAEAAMRMALKKAKLNPEEIDYINAHGTSTPMGDEIELKAISRVFENCINEMPISSTKSSTGHALGAAGAIEAVICLKAMEEGIIPATINLEDPDDFAQKLNLVANKTQKKKLKNILSNSFGFGGCNACLIFSKTE